MVTLGGGLINATVTPNLDTGELYADNKLYVSVEVFSSGTIVLEITDLPLDVAKVLFGVGRDGDEEGSFIHRADDSRPYGGFAYIRTFQDDSTGKTFYRGYYFPKVQAALGAETAQTKGRNISFGTKSITLTVFACKFEDQWQEVQEFDKKTEAEAWTAGKLGVKTV